MNTIERGKMSGGLKIFFATFAAQEFFAGNLAFYVKI